MTDYITAPQAAQQLGCSVRTVHRAAERAGIPKIAGRYLLTTAQVDQLRHVINDGPGNPDIGSQSAKGVAARRR
jgi:hypothetical protein